MGTSTVASAAVLAAAQPGVSRIGRVPSRGMLGPVQSGLGPRSRKGMLRSCTSTPNSKRTFLLCMLTRGRQQRSPVGMCPETRAVLPPRRDRTPTTPPSPIPVSAPSPILDSAKTVELPTVDKAEDLALALLTREVRSIRALDPMILEASFTPRVAVHGHETGSCN